MGRRLQELLVRMREVLHDRGGAFRVCSATDSVANLFRSTDVIQVLSIISFKEESVEDLISTKQSPPPKQQRRNSPDSARTVFSY